MKLPWWAIVAEHATQYVKLENVEYCNGNKQIISSAEVVGVGDSSLLGNCAVNQVVTVATPFQAVFWRD